METAREFSTMRDISPNRTKSPRRLGGSSQELAREVDRLSALDAAALRQRWMALFGADASPRGRPGA
jgi:hypothetical protein